MELERFRIGLPLFLINNGDGIIEDKLTVVSFKEGEGEDLPRVCLQSVVLDPGELFEFQLFADGWRWLFGAPFTNGKVYSKNGSVYSLESIMHKNCINKKVGDFVEFPKN